MDDLLHEPRTSDGFPAQWQVTAYRADGSIRDTAIFRNADEADERSRYYVEQGLRVVIKTPAELRARYEARIASKTANSQKFAPPPFSGPGWDDAWRNGPGSDV